MPCDERSTLESTTETRYDGLTLRAIDIPGLIADTTSMTPASESRYAHVIPAGGMNGMGVEEGGEVAVREAVDERVDGGVPGGDVESVDAGVPDGVDAGVPESVDAAVLDDVDAGVPESVDAGVPERERESEGDGNREDETDGEGGEETDGSAVGVGVSAGRISKVCP